ncbi:hypothetical protein IJT17_06200 [bacterium]|nr:hypothetical protein [bacterium]
MECTREWYCAEIRRIFEQVLPEKLQSRVRPGQVDMAMAVAEAVWNAGTLAVEAGTGVGKSLAYLIPLAIWRLQGGESAPIVSTKTINLQGQLMHKDVPFVRGLLRELYGSDLRVIEALGMSNYICRRRLALLIKQRQDMTAEERSMLERVAEVVNRCDDRYGLFASEAEGTAPLAGTRSECNVSPKVWQMVRCDKWLCPKKRCPYYNECFHYQNRRSLHTADIIVANHSLVLSDASLRRSGGSGILPSFDVMVFDEAHHLEDVATNQLSYSFMQSDCMQIINRVQNHEERPGEEPLLARLQMALNEGRDIDRHSSWMRVLDSLEYGCLDSLRDEIFHFFERLRETFADTLRQNGGKITLTGQIWDETADEYEVSLGEEASGVLSRLHSCAALLSEAESLAKFSEDETMQEFVDDISLAKEQVLYLAEALKCALDYENDEWVNWIEVYHIIRSRSGREVEYTEVGLKSALLHIGSSLQEYLFQYTKTLVLASATLKIRGKMDFFLHSIGLPCQDSSGIDGSGITALSCDSPFSYREQALLAIATDVPEYIGRGGYSCCDEVLEPLAELITALRGRTLMLFTSWSSLNLMGDMLSQRLAGTGIRVLIQGRGGVGRHALVRDFCTQERCVLLGTDSFWEGIDVQGEALQCVIVFKLPFVSPEEPLHKARIENIKNHGGNPFASYSIPLAVTKLRQGVGRLIRSVDDRGVILILDSRLETKHYGREIINSLPPFTCQRRPLRELVENSMAWIGVGGQQELEFKF